MQAQSWARAIHAGTRIWGVLDRAALRIRPWFAPPRWWIAIALLSAAVAVALWGRNLDAQWGMRDDHEIAAMLGDDGRVKISEFPRLFLRTDVGQAGRTSRFRPSFWALRITEAILWGDSPALWYGARLVLFAAGFAFFWAALARGVGLAAAGIFLLFCMTYDFWGDIWCKLGASESYAMFGMALTAFGAAEILAAANASARGRVWHWVVLAVGAAIAIGSKENFVLLLVPVWGLAVYCLRRKCLTKTAMVCAGLVTVYGLWVAWFTVQGVARTGTDIYGDPAGILYRLSLVPRGMLRAMRDLNGYDALAGIVILAVLAGGWRHVRPLRGLLIGWGAVLAACLLLYVSQYVFYAGRWPTRVLRFDFPGMMAKPVAWLAGACVLLEALRRTGTSAGTRRAVYAAMLGALAGATFVAGFDGIRQRQESNVRATRAFTAQIRAHAAVLKASPGRPALIVSTSRLDCDPAISIQRFLTAQGVRNPFGVRLDWNVAQTGLPERERQLGLRMMRWTVEGGEGFTPLRLLPQGAEPFTIRLHYKPGS